MVCPMTGHSDFHLFKEGVKPTWDDTKKKKKIVQVDYLAMKGLGVLMLGESHLGYI